MNLGAVIHSYGGPVLFVWAWLQGEAAVIVGGSLAAQGYWPWWAVWLLACVPGTLGHQIYFALGRRFGDPLLALLPARVQPAIARARALVHRNDARVMLLMRCVYPPGPAGRALDAGGGVRDEPARDGVSPSRKRVLPAALVQPHRRGRAVQSRAPRERGRGLRGGPPPGWPPGSLPHPERPPH